MKCPVCKEPDLVMSDRRGIEIDYCPACRGIWLDRGELDKIVEKSLEPGQNPSDELPRPPVDAYYDHKYDNHHYKQDEHKRWKRKSWLGEIFD